MLANGRRDEMNIPDNQPTVRANIHAPLRTAAIVRNCRGQSSIEHPGPDTLCANAVLKRLLTSRSVIKR
jgi:hypothetical protein